MGRNAAPSGFRLVLTGFACMAAAVSKPRPTLHLAGTFIQGYANPIVQAHLAYRCLTCGISESSCICQDCFDPDQHIGHNYRMYRRP